MGATGGGEPPRAVRGGSSREPRRAIIAPYRHATRAVRTRWGTSGWDAMGCEWGARRAARVVGTGWGSSGGRVLDC